MLKWDQPACYQHTVQKPVSVMSCACIAAHIMDNTAAYTDFGATYADIKKTWFSGNKTMPHNILHLANVFFFWGNRVSHLL